MATLHSETDAGFFQLIHQLAVSRLAKDPCERRTEPRHAFDVYQRIAPLRGPDLPDEAEFFPVQCQDLNRGGFSFLFDDVPNFDLLAVAFGKHPNVIYLSAEIIHHRKVFVSAAGIIHSENIERQPTANEDRLDEFATPFCLVSCRFIERLTRK